ncbi:MAG: hypothetical protein WA625_10855 [Pseudolabrys sp.]
MFYFDFLVARDACAGLTGVINGGWGGNWDGMMGNYNEPNADGEMEHAGNHVSELLQSLTAFLRIEA